ncbi:sensor domain-containing diguanylate cyclase [Colwellia sp. RSH04]|uniref:sensor domain-containing diguanylate cyclase n=1 Tax=Colwellia sp. RSH04 TaxID=2305464 RepID=UPI000E597CC6|nr:sensor domain-containing diguanylate cyclase [Colwellia sp. RSH04]RHW77732.1 diguanylate cyclase [Colwellia sp. RSH04]
MNPGVLTDEISKKFAEKLSSKITDQLNTGILIVDTEFNIVMWNSYLQVHSTKVSNDIIGKNIFDIFSELPQRWLSRKLASVLQLGTPNFCSWEQRRHLFELPHTRPITTDCEFMAQNCTFLPMQDDGDIEHICILIEDATDVCHYQGQLQKALDKLALMSRIDGLTQIYNRKHWQESLEQEFAKARRHEKALSLIMFDLDNFKHLNDHYGHQGGDEVLIEISKTIGSLLRVEDVFGRYGGEEFAIVLPETPIKGALELAERICQTVEKSTITFKDKDINVTVSLGVAQLSESDTSFETLIMHADDALYLAKNNGRNQVCSAKTTEFLQQASA